MMYTVLLACQKKKYCPSSKWPFEGLYTSCQSWFLPSICHTMLTGSNSPLPLCLQWYLYIS